MATGIYLPIGSYANLSILLHKLDLQRWRNRDRLSTTYTSLVLP